jgi:hypothetical protein
MSVLSVRNNNPGNLRPRGSNAGFQRFEDPASGLEAMKADLRVKVTGRSPAMKAKFGDGYQPTLRNLISVYAPSEENDTDGYVSFVSSKSGINPDQPLSEADIDKFVPAMVEQEGGKEAVDHFFGGQQAQPAKISGIADIRKQYPQYDDMSDTALADALHKKYYSDLDPKAVYEKLGVTPEVADKGYIPENPTAKDFARTAFDQSMQGATFGFADEVTDRIGAGIAALATGEKYGDVLKEARSTTSARLAEQQEEMPGTTIASNIAGGLATGVAGATTKTGGAVGRVLRSGNLPARVVKGAAAGAASGAAYGAGTAEDGERAKGARDGGIVGLGVGAAAPAVVAGAGAVKNAVIPKIDDALKPLAQRARDLGIPLRLDQVSPTRARQTVQKITQEVPFSGVDNFEEAQRKAFTQAVAKTIGQDAEDLGPETVKKFRESADEKFSSVLKGETITFDRNDLKALDDIAINADETIDPGLAAVVRKNVAKIEASLSTGEIDGQKLNSIRSEMLKKATRAQGGSKEYLGDIVEFIDDNISRSVHPKKAEILKQARREWRNFRTIQPLLKKSTDGTVNPTELLNKVTSSKYIDASKSSVGDDDLVDLARIGKKFLPKRGGSDTFQKSALTMGAIATPGALYGGLTGDSGADRLSRAAMYGLAPIAIARGVQKYNTSNPLINAALKRTTTKKITSVPINPLIAASANQ